MAPTRCAIVGTAPTWTRTPFTDPGLRIATLNDAYSLGLPRIDEHYELHPFDRMWFRPKDKTVFRKQEIPEGVYIRPEGHLEWLQRQAATIPVWLKDAPPTDWPANAQRFPVEALEAKYGTYWASGPAYMLMHLYDRGYRDISIYGIHLATAAEYREQRGNLEFLCGRILGAEVRESVAKEIRTYAGRDCTIRLPVEAPILSHGWKYAYDMKPMPVDGPAKQRLVAARQQYSTLAETLVTWPRWKSKRAPLAELGRIRAVIRDAEMQARHLRVQAGVT